MPAGIIEERGKTNKDRPYTELLSKKSGAKEIPPAPSSGHKEAPTIEGTWVRNMASGPAIYVGNDAKQKHRDEQAFYGHRYSEAIKRLRQKKFGGSERGVPLEWFTWDRIVVDECHECLVSSAKQDQESKASDFKAQARRGAREFLGVGCTDASSRPLLARAAIWGLTGTPLLETEARVTELANLMGGEFRMVPPCHQFISNFSQLSLFFTLLYRDISHGFCSPLAQRRARIWSRYLPQSARGGLQKP